MREETFVELQTPPLPYYWESGCTVFRTHDRHPNRRQFGLFDLLFVVSGTLHIGENGKEWSLAEGDTLLLLPEGEHYSVKPCERETVFYWVHFEHALWREGRLAQEDAVTKPLRSPFDAPKAIRIPKQSRLPHPAVAFDTLQRLIDLPIGEFFWEKQYLLMRLLALLEDKGFGVTSTPATRLAEKAASYLQQNYRDDITNESLAEVFHFHPNYVVRCMKMRYGITPSQYLLQFRMERAKQLLISTDWSVDRIAEEIGFQYSTHFIACFKRSAGITPLRFRKQHWD
ncbi:AraC-like DNA-binding protein [Paenibacillus phyllosphaerae]|uniref:AraC-like DNA-binding protein n=1 Tax=Paenibacillus phyllosphaerae TaxID=274593 RepID=A0A7W5B285_9BACL|nr:AraC-like DNA-binding protein [Paenibacillus phyllosphaerae]